MGGDECRVSREVMFGGVVSLESDLRDHREGMEETRRGEEKLGNTCASSRCIPQGELWGCSDLWLHLILTFTPPRSSHRCHLPREGA